MKFWQNPRWSSSIVDNVVPLDINFIYEDSDRIIGRAAVVFRANLSPIVAPTIAPKTLGAWRRYWTLVWREDYEIPRLSGIIRAGLGADMTQDPEWKRSQVGDEAHVKWDYLSGHYNDGQHYYREVYQILNKARKMAQSTTSLFISRRLGSRSLAFFIESVKGCGPTDHCSSAVVVIEQLVAAVAAAEAEGHAGRRRGQQACCWYSNPISVPTVRGSWRGSQPPPPPAYIHVYIFTQVYIYISVCLS